MGNVLAHFVTVTNNEIWKGIWGPALMSKVHKKLRLNLNVVIPQQCSPLAVYPLLWLKTNFLIKFKELPVLVFSDLLNFPQRLYLVHASFQGVPLRPWSSNCVHLKVVIWGWWRENLIEGHSLYFWMFFQSLIDFAFTLTASAIHNGEVQVSLRLLLCKCVKHWGGVESSEESSKFSVLLKLSVIGINVRLARREEGDV